MAAMSNIVVNAEDPLLFARWFVSFRNVMLLRIDLH